MLFHADLIAHSAGCSTCDSNPSKGIGRRVILYSRPKPIQIHRRRVPEGLPGARLEQYFQILNKHLHFSEPCSTLGPILKAPIFASFAGTLPKRFSQDLGAQEAPKMEAFEGNV